MIQAKGIEKSFGALKVLKGIDFSAEKSEVDAGRGLRGHRVLHLWGERSYHQELQKEEGRDHPKEGQSNAGHLGRV